MPTLYHSLVLLTDAALKPKAPRLPSPASHTTDLQVPYMQRKKRGRSPNPDLDQLAQLAYVTEDLFSTVSEDETVSEAEIALAEQLLAPSHSVHAHSLSNSSSDTNLAANCPALSNLLDGLVSAATRDQHAASREASGQGFLADDDLLQGHDAQPFLNRSYASAEQQFAEGPLLSSSDPDDSFWSVRHASTAACLAGQKDAAVHGSARQPQRGSFPTAGMPSLQQHDLQQATNSYPDPEQPAQHMYSLTSAPSIEPSSQDSQDRGRTGRELLHTNFDTTDDQEQLLVQNPLAADSQHWSIGKPFDVHAVHEDGLKHLLGGPSDQIDQNKIL